MNSGKRLVHELQGMLCFPGLETSCSHCKEGNMSVTECTRVIRQKKIWWLKRDTSITDSKIKEAFPPPSQSLIEKTQCKIMNNTLNNVLIVNTVSFDCFSIMSHQRAIQKSKRVLERGGNMIRCKLSAP